MADLRQGRERARTDLVLLYRNAPKEQCGSLAQVANRRRGQLHETGATLLRLLGASERECSGRFHFT